MIATELMLITLGGDADPVIRLWDLNLKTINTAKILLRAITGPVRIKNRTCAMSDEIPNPYDIAYSDGLLLVSTKGATPKIFLYGVEKLLQEGKCNDLEFRKEIFAEMPSKIKEIRWWRVAAEQIQFHNRRIIFLAISKNEKGENNSYINLIDLDLSFTATEEIASTQRIYSRIIRCGKFLVAMLPSEVSVDIWNFH